MELTLVRKRKGSRRGGTRIDGSHNPTKDRQVGLYIKFPGGGKKKKTTKEGTQKRAGEKAALPKLRGGLS